MSNTVYTYSVNRGSNGSTIASLIGNGGWLATVLIDTTEEKASYCPMFIFRGNVGRIDSARSNATGGNSTNGGLTPFITLRSTLQLNESGIGQTHTTADTAWEIME